jgi:hypothetical protein
MSRVTLNYDDGSKIDFNDAGDALYHLKTQGAAGVVDMRTEGEKGKALYTGKRLRELQAKATEFETRDQLNVLLKGD